MKVKDLLVDPSKWTQGSAARDRFGEPCPSDSDIAVSYCIIGAICRVYANKDQRIEAARRVTEAIFFLGWECRGALGIGGWNDYPTRTFTDVRQVLEKADI